MNEVLVTASRTAFIHQIVINPMQIGIKLERMGNRPQTIDHLALKIVQSCPTKCHHPTWIVIPPLLVVR